MNKEDASSYRNIIKATSIFGGVQAFQIIIQIIKIKFTAVFLGPAGMGIIGLLSAVIDLITNLTDLKLSTSAVKNVSEAHGACEEKQVRKIVAVVRSLVWITGLVGVFVTIFFAPWLSEFSFGNEEYTYAFIWLSIVLLFNQLSSGQRVILQGLRRIELLSKATLIGSFLSLLITIPLYYYYRIDGVVPAMILSSLVALMVMRHYSQKVELLPYRLTLSEAYYESKGILAMGFLLSLNASFNSATSYILKIIISDAGGVEDVGLYTAGFAIIGTYLGLVFTAMSTDYYPRLSAVPNEHLDLSHGIINHQIEIAVLLLGPMIVIFMVFVELVTIVLYSSEFIGMVEMLSWAVFGMLFKIPSWAISILFLAKSDRKVFFFSELAAGIYTFLLNWLGYSLLGITGLGISFVITYMIYTIQVYLIAKYKYRYYFSKDFLIFSIIYFIILVSIFISTHLFSNLVSNAVGSIAILISLYYSYKELDKRLNIKNEIHKLIKK